MLSTVSDALNATTTIDSNHARIKEFTRSHTSAAATVRDKAIRLYYAVRDGICYDPYSIDLSVDGMRASTTLAAGHGWCVPKAVLLAACCRSAGIPARLGFADVKNHLTTERMRKLMNTNIFFWHGYTILFIDGKWVKATPAFNIELCDRFHFKPLDFDGSTDSIYHPVDQRGNAHMEYIHDRGQFSDLPLDQIKGTLKRRYGSLCSLPTADVYHDVDKERTDRVPPFPTS